jgi:hypothetical protein
MIACACTERKCCCTIGWNMAVSIVMLTVALMTFVPLLRVYESGLKDIQNINQNGLEKADFGYLYSSLLELVILLFVYTPMIQLILFSGIL